MGFLASAVTGDVGYGGRSHCCVRETLQQNAALCNGQACLFSEWIAKWVTKTSNMVLINY